MVQISDDAIDLAQASPRSWNTTTVLGEHAFASLHSPSTTTAQSMNTDAGSSGLCDMIQPDVPIVLDWMPTNGLQPEWFETDDILALLTGDDGTFSLGLEESFTQLGELTSGISAVGPEAALEFNAISTHGGEQAMQQVQQSFRDLVSNVNTAFLPDTSNGFGVVHTSC